LLIISPHRQQHKKGFLKWTNLLFYVANGLAILLNCIDFIYYRFTNRRTSMMVFDEFAGETNYLKLLYHFIKDYYYIGLILIVLIISLILLTKKQTIAKPLLSGWKYLIINTVITVIVTGISIIGLRGGLPPKQDFPLNPSDAGQYVKHPNDIAIVLNTPFTMLLSMDKPAYPVKQYFRTADELEAIYTPLHQADTGRTKHPVNVVVIMVESLGREPIGFYNQNIDNGRYKGYTPFIDSLCERSYVFMNSYANSRISIEGSPAVTASIPSLQESYTVSLYSGNKIMSLASCLKGMGYQTYYFHGAPNGSLGLNSFANVAGFEHYVGKTEYNNDADFDGVWGIWDHLFLPFVVNYLKNIKSPFFSFIFTVTSHHPYKIPDYLKDKLPNGTIEIHKSMAYADYSLREFFNSASKQEWFDKTLFVITGDHTCSAYYPEYHTTVGAYTVPIIFYQPGSTLIGKDSIPAQQIDIMPTILNYVGYRKPYFAFGQDLFAPDSAKFVVNYAGNSFQLINNEWVLQFDLEKTISMYHLRTDPEMTDNLAGKNMPVQYFLEKQVKAFIQQYNGRMVNNQLIYQ
jgi:phosphoglycerol transferase MdoB-like AlkP superfamily enzyme